MQKTHTKTHHKNIRVNGILKELITVKDASGKIIHKTIKPLKVEFYPRDFFQVLVGAFILTVPVGFTEEVWRLGAELSIYRIAIVAGISLASIAVFTYYNVYQKKFKEHQSQYTKRVLITYLTSIVIAGLFLTLIDKAEWNIDFLVALKRTILVALPASMSAVVADMVK